MFPREKCLISVDPMPTPAYPKRLIEVDLPIKKISEHARREKSIRHGHISTLHVWWARRPLAACRAVICAALWPDPADPLCPERFRCEAEDVMRQFWNPMGVTDRDFSDPIMLRQALLDFIADFSNWDNSTNERYLSTARKLTQIAHESLGGAPGTRPLVVDPFAGGGSIPLEALRVGADAYASDLNPVAVLLNKVVLEYIPKYGKELADEVRKWGQWVKEEAEKELAEFYPKDPDGAIPIAYLWARTIQCEGPGCGAEIPLIGQVWLSKKVNKAYAFSLILDKNDKKIQVNIIKNPNSSQLMSSITNRGSVTCPICQYSLKAKRLRELLSRVNGGSDSSKLLATVLLNNETGEKKFRIGSERDFVSYLASVKKLDLFKNEFINNVPTIPNETTPPKGALGYRIQNYGINKWRNIYNSRQLTSLITILRIINGENIKAQFKYQNYSIEKQKVIQTFLGLALGRLNDYSSSINRWEPGGEFIAAANGGENHMSMVLDYVEANPISGSSGSWNNQIDWISRVIDNLSNSFENHATVTQSAIQNPSLPDDIAEALITDPPYYDAFGYADLSEFFYIWLKRAIPPDVLNYNEDHVPKKDEIIAIDSIIDDDRGDKSDESFLFNMTLGLGKYRNITKSDGIGVIIFANKSTKGWEAILNSIVNSGWIITGAWPMDTERPSRTRAINSSALQSSIHLVCRPRENPDGSLREEIGDWRDVLAELPTRIHEWMPRLAKEGVVGADAIFACLGPALEIFSRYSRVEKASGEEVTLREYLEHVWAAVSREALGMIFEGADATGFEEDARITAMWLWTLKTAESPAFNGKNGNGIKEQQEQSEEEEEEEEGSGKKKVKGFSLEYDAARKIAQGLGAHIEEMHTLVEIKKGNARLLPVSERAAYLLKSDKERPVRRIKKKEKQATLFPLELEGGEIPEEDFGDVAEIGKTTLDRVHQSMLLFAAGQSDALKRFLVDEGIGKNAQFWKLAQALAALYPTGTEEKRWVEGVLARKKGLGL